jgi:hypothetical protein
MLICNKFIVLIKEELSKKKKIQKLGQGLMNLCHSCKSSERNIINTKKKGGTKQISYF